MNIGMEKIICNAWYYKNGEKYCPFMQDGVCKIHSGNSMIECGMSKEKEGNSDNDKKENQPLGWICPRCGKVNSPFIPECDCPPPIKITTDSGSYNSLELKNI